MNTYKHIPKYNLFNLYTVSDTYVFMADQLALDV